MKKTRKILSAFAVSLVAVFALSCCFFAACGNKDEEETESTHTHTYSGGYSYDETGHWQVCDDCGEKTAVDSHEFEIVSTAVEPTCTTEGKGTQTCSVCGYTEEDVVIEALGHDYVLDEENSTAAKCTEGGQNVYVCSRCDDTETETVAALGHDCTVEWTWAEDYTSATASRSACSRGDLQAETATVNGSEIMSDTLSNGDVTYTATVTFSDGTAATDTITVEANVETPDAPDSGELPISVDFSKPETFTWITYRNPANSDGVVTLDNASTYTDGILTIYTARSDASTPMSINGEEFPGGLNMTGKTELSDGNYYKYIEINLEGYVNEAVSFSITMDANGNTEEGRWLYLSDTLENPSTGGVNASKYLASASSTAKDSIGTLSTTLEITEASTTLYLICDTNINIYTIDIAVTSDYTPERVQAMTGTDTCFGETWTLENFEIIDTVDNADGSVTYKITASAGQMTSPQAEAFGGSEYANEGDLFVSFKIYVNAGETVTYTTANKTGSEEFTESGYFTFVERITVSDELYGQTAVGLGETAIVIKITDENNVTTTMNLWFGHIDLPADYWGTGIDDDTQLTAIVELDFTDGSKFSASTQGSLIGDSATEPVSLTYSDGTETGFTLTKSSSSNKYNGIVTTSETQVLQMQGSAKTTQNSLGYELEAGTYVVKITYFQGSSTTWDRYATVLGSSGSVYGSAASTEHTVSDGQGSSAATAITASIEISLSAADTIYIGSASSGLYIMFVGIYSVV